MMRDSSRLGRRGSCEKVERKPDSRSHLEYFRSVRRLSDGASDEFRSLMRKNSKHLPVFNRTQRENRSSQTYVSCLIDDLSWALQFMEVHPIDLKHVEEMAVFIHQAGSSSSRGFHNCDLIFQVTGGASPIQLLAAFFRDTVVHYVDGIDQMSPKQQQILEGIFQKQPPPSNSTKTQQQQQPDDRQWVLTNEFFQDEVMNMIAQIFDVTSSSSLEKQFEFDPRGMDIFLSAITAVKFLKKYLQIRELTQIVVCMNRTIPFRSKDEFGRSASDRLYWRLVEVNQNFNLTMTEMELELTCQMATDLSNRIMGVYAAPDPEIFIAQTWGLLPELNAPLRQNKLYSLQDYYHAIWEMYRFVSDIDPSIYDTFRGIPKESEIIEFQKAFVKNQTVGATYLKLKVVEVATITALAMLTGGADVPKSMFYGDLIPKMSALGDALPELDPKEVGRNGCYAEVYDMMYAPRFDGTTGCQCFDQENSPVAAYIYGQIGETTTNQIFEKCVHPMTTCSSWELIESMPYKVIEVLVSEIIPIAPSRADLLEEILTDLQTDTDLSRQGSCKWKSRSIDLSCSSGNG